MTKYKAYYKRTKLEELFIRPVALEILVVLLRPISPPGWFVKRIAQHTNSNIPYISGVVSFLDKIGLVKRINPWTIKPTRGTHISKRMNPIILTEQGRKVATKLFEIKEIVN